MVILFALATIVSTYLGGLFALRFKDKLHLILGYSAGAVIGVAFFDLLPEAIELSSGRYELSTVTSLVALGFVAFMMLSRWLHGGSHDDHDHCENQHHKGTLGVVSLSIHSFLDGMAIGLAFKVSVSVGLVVAIAVLLHDFSDGINTVGMIMRSKGDRQRALRWLAVDALAPALGVLSTLFFSIPETSLGLILAVFCGFFFYIGASDLLPESHHNHPTFLTTFMTALGILTLYVAISLAGV